MSSSSFTPAALVTGANKGIGYEVVRQLSPQFKGTVYLTARNVQLGEAAESALHKEGFANVKFVQMDVTDQKTIGKARDLIKEKHGGLDILINNAGIFVGNGDLDAGIPVDQSLEATKKTLDTNFFGVLNTCKFFFPILREHARVVQVSSTLGSLVFLNNHDLRKKFMSDNFTTEDVERIFADYLRSAEKGTSVADGYPDKFGPYAMSKIGVCALARSQQRDFDREKSRPDIVVNSVCPGYVATDINNNAGQKSVAEGADSIVYLALLPPSVNGEQIEPRGEFVYERRVYDWVNVELSDILKTIVSTSANGH